MKDYDDAYFTSNNVDTDVQLSAEQLAIFQQIETSDSHFYITGKAGTGKSMLLQYLRENTQKRVVVVASTGIAALNIGGQTIHSLFGIAPGLVRPETIVVNRRSANILRHIDMVIVDEISMVRADLMDAMDQMLQLIRRSREPFGNVKMIMFGDLFQLPPVVERVLHPYFNETYGGYYFFDAHVWQHTPLAVLELDHIFRQKDEYFKSILNGIRMGDPTQEMIDALNTRANRIVPDHNIVTLATVNGRVNQINSDRMSWLPSTTYHFQAKINGSLEGSAFPTEESLALKEGAQVMLLRNDRDKRWVNGSIGRVHRLADSLVEVEVGGDVHEIKKESWSKIRYGYNADTDTIQEESVSSFTQYPLRLAWAVTIHKSQGLTYDHVAVDLGNGSFAHGQTYVALSRCTTLDGLFLSRPILPRDIMVDERILRFEGTAT